MMWIKIYSDLNEARAALGENKANTVQIEGKKLCLAIVENAVVAISDRCTHNGESLGKGKINFQGEVVCPWHGYRFNLKTGRCSANAPDAEIFPVHVEPDGIFIKV